MMRQRFLPVAVLPAVLLIFAASAVTTRGQILLPRPPGGGSEAAGGGTPSETPSQHRFPPALALPALSGPKPWSDKPVLDDPDRFQIAIMSDNTGGHRPGIWMSAVQKLNLLRPQFVMSVGDLIEGYSEDRAVVEGEWAEFLGFIDQMQMKFFFVAGNHDLTNPVMHEIWREHFGPEWYSFNYRGVHFLCLCSEDPRDNLSDAQVEWVRHDLQEHRDARWTLVFLHKPLWLTAERAKLAGNPDPTNWTQVEELLGHRPHTVFAGHVHHYVQYDRRGTRYYHLGTTGGASQLRGVPYGEFDHITWLTMEPDGPQIGNLLLDGILAPDAVTESGIARFRDFLAQTRVEVAPILLDQTEGFATGQIELRLVNEFAVPVELTGRIDGLPLRGLFLEPAALKLRAEPGETARLAVQIQFSEAIEFSHLAGTLLDARLTTVEAVPLVAERSVPVVIDRLHPCKLRSSAVQIDGDIGEWSELPYATGNRPSIVGPAQQWQGVGDAELQFTLEYDGEQLYFAGTVTDDAVLQADGIELRLDARPLDVRAAESEISKTAVVIQLPAPDGAGRVTATVRGRQSSVVPVVKGRRTTRGYDMECAVPIDVITSQQGAMWHSFQATAVLTDVDAADEEPCQILWRGLPEFPERNTNWGHFIRQE